MRSRLEGSGHGEEGRSRPFRKHHLANSVVTHEGKGSKEGLRFLA
jgi:hypothetical protein